VKPWQKGNYRSSREDLSELGMDGEMAWQPDLTETSIVNTAF